MNIIVNQQTLSFEHKVNMPKVIEEGKFIPPYAVLLNDEFLPKSQYQDTWLKENDKVEIVGAIQGG
ncbi:sulfur carrier protein ThiS [Thiomicrorhabdus sp.]|uniref:sulfur carrier protein ThiS n=1 Tax=Thiomicrorhabdus sp. TaxID=2039724 RepID=UPI002AA70961|nr:sulfur carrier protein ThiS [Thiomicrorhabdus sp.]